ncbi:shikimate dehydrogenase, partial [bacterium]|nr:shikimate dehydrogenase [bacterium]
YLDELSPQARLVGAVNTIVNQNGRLIGHTTDGDGFLLALQNEYQAAPAGKRICLIGAGGSARSIAFSLAHHGAAEIVIANRTRYRAEILAHDVQEAYPSALLRAADFHIAAMPHLLSEMDWIINTTPIGMAPSVGDTPINDMSWVSDAHLVCDIIYTPNPTRFLREAGERGAVISSGAGMLAGQGVLAFQLFSGREVPFKVMRNEV